MQIRLQLALLASTAIGFVIAEFQNPYPPVAALFGPRDKFICNAVVLRKGQILTSADCLFLKKNRSYSLGTPEQFHVALETHTIEQLHSGKAFDGGKSSKWKYLEKLSQKFGFKYDNKYGNEVFSDKLKPKEVSYLMKTLQSSGTESKPKRTNYVPVASFRIHPEFKNWHSNDLVVLEVSERFPVENASIANVSQKYVESAFNRVVQVHGFGVLSHGANETNRPVYFKVRTVEMYLLPPGRCQQDLGDLFNRDQHLCLKPKGNETLCLGFTGAPIVLDGKLIGIVEFGHASCSLESPVVGIRLDRFHDFLGLAAPSTSILEMFRKLIDNIRGVFL